MTEEELKNIKNTLAAQGDLLSSIDKRLKSMKRQMMWGTISGITKFLLIAVPLVLGFLLFSPQIRQYSDQWGLILSTLKLSSPETSLFNTNNKNNSSINIASFCDAQERQKLVDTICSR